MLMLHPDEHELHTARAHSSQHILGKWELFSTAVICNYLIQRRMSLNYVLCMFYIQLVVVL